MKKIICFFILGIALSWNFASAEIIIIANSEIPQNELSEAEIKQIFLAKQKKWPDNTVIKPAVLSDQNLHTAFLKQYIKRSYSQWKAYWKRMLFTGQGLLPKRFQTEKELLEYITATPGSIGYVDARTPFKNVKPVEIYK